MPCVREGGGAPSRGRRRGRGTPVHIPARFLWPKNVRRRPGTSDAVWIPSHAADARHMRCIVLHSVTRILVLILDVLEQLVARVDCGTQYAVQPAALHTMVQMGMGLRCLVSPRLWSSVGKFAASFDDRFGPRKKVQPISRG